MRLLLIEDEAPNAAIIKRGLEEEGYRVEVARDGSAGLKMALTDDYAAIILDLMLPGLDGWQVCERLRARRNATPLLILTARGAVEDRVRGLELGADDYLPKPFDFSELLARVRALVRRDKIHKGRNLCVDRLEIDTALRRVTCDGQEVRLTPQEYALLEALARYEGRTLTREFILNQIWNSEDSFSNSVDVHIGQLRKKVDAGYSTKLIHTVHRLGYMLKRAEEEETGQ